MVRILQRALLFVVIIAAMLAGSAVAQQQNPKRLILKDGSYQSVTKWEVNGKKVRYYSAERFMWEEVPNDLIDWAATEKYNQERETQRTVKAAPAEQDKIEAEVENPETPLIAPGLRLPDGGGVFLFDTFQSQPQLLQLGQNGGELNKHMGKNILRAAINPTALSSKQTVDLKGEKAKVQSHVPQPPIFVNVDSSPLFPQEQTTRAKPESKPQYGIVRLEVKKGMRQVGDLNVAVYGKVSHKENWVKTTSTPVGDWIKVVPDEPLTPGEYAVVELLDKGQINLYVWDFGVDPSAPANPNAWTPRKPVQGQNGSSAPALEKRPK